MCAGVTVFNALRNSGARAGDVVAVHGIGGPGHAMTSSSADGKTIVFTSESIENIPAGYRARETYKILGPDEFTETFEIAEPGKDFEIYSEGHFKRKK
jgi:D-arabinose 1-dehydrogenase-like Zn-dependent alcohol dehydrogenase